MQPLHRPMPCRGSMVGQGARLLRARLLEDTARSVPLPALRSPRPVRILGRRRGGRVEMHNLCFCAQCRHNVRVRWRPGLSARCQRHAVVRRCRARSGTLGHSVSILLAGTNLKLITDRRIGIRNTTPRGRRGARSRGREAGASHATAVECGVWSVVC